MNAVLDLAAEWRAEADVLRRRGAEGPALALESCADDLEDRVRGWELEVLTLEEAAELSGYSYSHLQHLVAESEVPNAGTRGAPRIRRSDLPRKPGHGRPARSRTELLDRSVRLQGGTP